MKAVARLKIDKMHVVKTEVDIKGDFDRAKVIAALKTANPYLYRRQDGVKAEPKT